MWNLIPCFNVKLVIFAVHKTLWMEFTFSPELLAFVKEMKCIFMCFLYISDPHGNAVPLQVEGKMATLHGQWDAGVSSMTAAHPS